MSRRGAPGLLRCVLPRACVGALGIGGNTGLHWLREVQGGEFGRGGDVDGMPRLGDDVCPGGDLWFKVTQDVAAGEGACVPGTHPLVNSSAASRPPPPPRTT